jgi:hypothetical protein
MQWEFDPDRLEAAVSQLVGQLVLIPDRDPTEVVSFGVGVDESGPKYVRCYLEIHNQLTRETATSLLHFLHHISSNTYFEQLYLVLWRCEYTQPSDLHWRQSEPTPTGTCINPMIFDALRQASGRRVLHLYALQRIHPYWKTPVIEESESVKIH